MQRLLFIFACIIGAFTGLLLYDSWGGHCFLCTNITGSGRVHCYGVEAHERTSASYSVCCMGKTDPMKAIGTRRFLVDNDIQFKGQSLPTYLLTLTS
jgi:hypothetical protein